MRHAKWPCLPLHADQRHAPARVVGSSHVAFSTRKNTRSSLDNYYCPQNQTHMLEIAIALHACFRGRRRRVNWPPKSTRIKFGAAEQGFQRTSTFYRSKLARPRTSYRRRLHSPRLDDQSQQARPGPSNRRRRRRRLYSPGRPG
jgi:hypothetical protein